MSIVERFPTTDPTIKQAEDLVNQAWSGSDQGFVEGVTGEHETFGSWFSSGLSGLVLSEALPPEQQRDLYIKRNSIEYGVSKINNTLEAFKALGQTRSFTEQEAATIKELQARKALIEEDLAFAHDRLDGDLDATMDVEGKSFNDRWGLDENEAGIIDFLASISDNPKYAAGMLTGEILKDLPMSALAWLGLTAKTAKGASAFSTLVAKLNSIQPKALRGIAKVGTPVGLGALGGASYEASYSLLNEGKVNLDDAALGAEFGAAFGLLGSLGVFASTPAPAAVKDIKPEKGETSFTPVEDSFEKVANELVDDDSKASVDVLVKSLIDNEAQIFPALQRGKDYELISPNEAKERGIWSKEREDTLAYVAPWEDKTKPQSIVWNQKAVDAKWKAMQDQKFNSMWDEDVSAIPNAVPRSNSYYNLSANEMRWVNNKDSFESFILGHEKAHVIQEIEGRQYAPHAYDSKYENGYMRESAAQKMAANEFGRLFKEQEFARADKSAVVANRQLQVYNEGKEFLPKDFDEKVRGLKKEETIPEAAPKSQVMNFLGKHKLAAPVAAGIAGYIAGGEDDAPFLAATGALAAAASPHVYRKLTEQQMSQTMAKARLQAATLQEGYAVYAKELELVGQTLGDRIIERFPGGRAEVFLEALEKGKRFTDPEAQKLADQWRDWMGFLSRQGAEVGLFQKKHRGVVSTTLVSNYVSHIIRGKTQPDGSVRPLTNKEKEKLINEQAAKIKVTGSTQTVHELPRKIEGTLKDLKEKGYAVVDDPAQILSIYSQAMARTIHNRKLLSEFKQLDVGTPEQPMAGLLTHKEFNDRVQAGQISKTDRKLYEDFDHPSLQGYKVHTNLKNILDDHFELAREGGLNDFAEGLLSLNNALKRIFVFGSLFHGQALVMSGIYSLGLTGAIKGVLGKGKFGKEYSWKDLELGSGTFIQLAKEAIKDGLQVVNIKRQVLVNPGKLELDEFLEKLGEPGKLGQKAFGTIDKITWEYLHDRYKLAAYLRHKEVLMRKGMDDVTAGEQAAIFANDAFGSLDWNKFATKLYDYAYKNPGKLRGKIATKTAQMMPVNKRRWLNLGLFAPDWTISNIRIVGRTMWNAPKVTNELIHKVHKGDWRSKEAKELVQAWNMYAAYSARAGFYTTGLWYAFTEMFSDEEPTMEALAEFWFGETSGKLQLGGGESQVISKQIAEPIHWLQHPQHTLLNKMSIVPKTVVEGLYNKQWFSMKKGFPMGPAIVDPDGQAHYGEWLLGKAIPIVAKPLIQDDLEWDERFERVFTGFFGFPQYGKPDE